MQITTDNIARVCAEHEIYNNLLSLDNKYIVELGCGTGVHTRAIASHGEGRRVTAFEVDRVQLEKNIGDAKLANIEFRYGGAESIECDDASVDVLMMFKSLHHVPTARLDDALAEIARVLKPGGLAYISEPIFAGAFNDVIRLFHDEQAVRAAAFAAVCAAVEQRLLNLVRQEFFLSPTVFSDFEDFRQRIINVTHSEHRLSPATHAEVHRLFERHMTPSGAEFFAPMRIDLLTKPTE